MKYQPPYSAEDVRRVYGAELLNHLFNDPCHRWRMETGIELIHREPTKDEFLRIVENWRLMDEGQKRISDAKSKELFGVGNMNHARQLSRLFDLPTSSAALLNRSAAFSFGSSGIGVGRFMRPRELLALCLWTSGRCRWATGSVCWSRTA